MKTKYFFLFSLLFILGCDYEDERASDFSVSSSVYHGLFSGNKVEGTVTNISSTPANKITLKLDMYDEDYEYVDYQYETIYETLYQNESAEFCVLLDDNITSVDVIITSVD